MVERLLLHQKSSALSAIGADLVRDVTPGELIKFSKNGVESEMFSEEKQRAHCSFEFTYFAHPASTMEVQTSIFPEKK